MSALKVFSTYWKSGILDVFLTEDNKGWLIQNNSKTAGVKHKTRKLQKLKTGHINRLNSLLELTRPLEIHASHTYIFYSSQLTFNLLRNKKDYRTKRETYCSEEAEMDFLHGGKIKRGHRVFTHPHSFFSLKHECCSRWSSPDFTFSTLMARCPWQALSLLPEVNLTDKYANSTDFQRDMGI